MNLDLYTIIGAIVAVLAALGGAFGAGYRQRGIKSERDALRENARAAGARADADREAGMASDPGEQLSSDWRRRL